MPARPDDHDDAADRLGPDEPAASSSANDEWESLVARLTQAGPDDAPATGTESRSPRSPDAFPVAPWVERRVVRPAGEPGDPRELAGRNWDGTAQYDAAESAVDEEEHFVPPDPGPVLGGDPLLTMAWLAVTGMPVLLLVVLVAWRNAPLALVQAAGVVFLLGIAVLVWRMPSGRRSSDRGDDDPGAVV